MTITHAYVGTTPVTVFRPVTRDVATAVVIAHGFAGSQQLMQPFAVTLARNGYVAVTFDFPGHGRNATPLPGGLADQDVRTRALLEALGDVALFARHLPHTNGRLALVGHSMASDLVVRYAQAHSDVEVTVAVSLFSPGVTASSPRNLLVIDGALEPGPLRNEAARIVTMTAGRPALERVTYGSFANGTARRFVFAEGVEHIGVLYSSESLAAALDWLNQASGHRSAGFLDARGAWLGLLYGGLVALAWPLAGLLPQVARTPLGAGYRWRHLLLLTVAPAVLTPLLLWQMPSDFLPLLLGGYLALHFGLYGVLTAAGMWVLARSQGLGRSIRLSRLKLASAVLAATAYSTLALGFPLDRFVTNMAPVAGRVPMILAMLAGTLPYFLADEWLTRGAAARRGAYVVTKICFLLSLAIAIALNRRELFFLVIIVPAILALFIVYGLLSTWIYRRTNSPLAGAVANAVVFAWAIAVTFPVVDR